MTTPAHGIMGGLVTYTITHSIWCSILVGILSIIPDIARLFQKDISDWTIYSKLHNIKSWWWIPGWNLHIILDYFMHNTDGKWYKWVYYAEVFFWIYIGFYMTVK